MATSPNPEETVTITGVRDGKTYAWVMKVTNVAQVGGSVDIHGVITNEGTLEGIDRRLDNQKKSIDGLLKHLQVHCPKMLGTGQTCDQGF